MRNALAAGLVVLLSVAGVAAQRGGGRGAAPQSARQAAALDLTGYWVSVVTEDWRYRMVTPNKGVFDALPLNAEGRRVGNLWDPARDEAAGEQCKAYGAAAIMRMPTRLRIGWQDDNTLKIETDAGMQTRLFHFGTPPAPGEPSWQGHSVAQWEYATAARGGQRLGSLKVVTTNLRPGYLRKNGAPYSDRTVVTEYFDVNTLPNGDQWMTVTTRVEDPVYLARPLLTTSDFKKLPGPTGWNPTPCSAR
ncbi:MAG TPA: hypothetical protein VNI78_08495 [Vicinamibacterales bacterium]|nr:hypothetical protein [Vicinamibacterales bacterium]